MRAADRKSGQPAARSAGDGAAPVRGLADPRAVSPLPAAEGRSAAPASPRPATRSSPAPTSLPATRSKRRCNARSRSATGADLSGVRVHTGAASAEAAAAVQARAYTVGHDVHFGAGQYQPHTREGQRLLAHELVHTVQQGPAGAKAQHKLEVSEPGDDAEREADQLADHIVDGKAGGAQSVRQAPKLSRAPMVQREAQAPKAEGEPQRRRGRRRKDPIVAKLDINADVEKADRTKLTMK